MTLKSIDTWAVPTVAGLPDIWGPWYGSDILLTTPGKSVNLTLNFATKSDAPSNFTVQIRYWRNGSLVIQNEPIAGDGSVSVTIGGDSSGSISQVYFRLQSTSIGQIVTVDSDTIGFQPISPRESSPIEYAIGGALDKYYIDNDGSVKTLPSPSSPDYPSFVEPFFLRDVAPRMGVPDWSVPAGGIFGDVPAIPILRGWGDPLVLDLDGDGVEVTKMGFGSDRSMVYFDMDNDGFAERTAWATGGDGLLALDKNGNGKIDNLFGFLAKPRVEFQN